MVGAAVSRHAQLIRLELPPHPHHLYLGAAGRDTDTEPPAVVCSCRDCSELIARCSDKVSAVPKTKGEELQPGWTVQQREFLASL